LHDERVENEKPYSPQTEAYFFYRFQNGHPVINTIAQAAEDKSLTHRVGHAQHSVGGTAPSTHRKLAQETVNLELSILAQRRNPELYPEITYLADTYEMWRIYRERAFGRNTVFREPQKADMRNDRLEEDFSNLGLFLSRRR